MKKLPWMLLGLVGAVALAGFVLAQGVPTDQPKSWGDTLQFIIEIVGPLVAAIAIGFRNPKELLSKKTTYTGLAIIAGTITAFFAGSIDLPTAVYGVAFGLVAIFLKDGQITTEKAVAQALGGLKAAKPSDSEREASIARATKRG